MLKLKAHGISGKVALWIEEWLNNRKQCVGIRGTLSELILMISGVPQGSLLGSLLFIITLILIAMILIFFLMLKNVCLYVWETNYCMTVLFT